MNGKETTGQPGRGTRWQSRRFLDALKRAGARAFLLVGGVTMLLPMAWMVVTSLKDDHTLQNRPTDWTLSLPARKRSGTLRLDAVFFVTEEFEEVDVAGFEAAGEQTIAPRGLSGSLTLPQWEIEADEATRARLARAGRSALEMTYDFRRTGTPASARITFPKGRTFRDLVGLHLWVYGDGAGHELNLRLETDRGPLVTQAPWEINFEHWRELSCYFRELDRLGGMPLLVRASPEATHKAGAPVQGPASEDARLETRDSGPDRGGPLDPAGPLDLEVRALELSLREVPYAEAVWNKITYNYRRIWDSIPLGLYYWNTLLVAFAITLGQVVTSSLAAYAFARLRFPGRDYLFYGYLATMMIPGDVTMIPTFIMVQKLGMFDSFGAIILPGLASTFGTFLLRQFFLSLPRDLEEAAMIDGCGPFGIYWRIILPLAKPALATLAVMSFIGAWNMFLWPLIITSDQDHWVLQVGLSKMQSLMGNRFNLMMAGALIALVPVVIIFTAAQRAFREGIVLSGMKG